MCCYTAFIKINPQNYYTTMATISKIVQFTTSLQMAAVEGGIAKVYSINETSAVPLSTQTITESNFQIDLNLEDDGYYYVVLQITKYLQNGTSYETDDRNISLLAVFRALDGNVSVSAQSTIANAFAFAQMITVSGNGQDVNIIGTERNMRIAYGMKNNFVATNGAVSKVISSSPNALETNSYPMFNTLSTILYYNIVDADVYTKYISLTGGTTFFQALMNMIRSPFDNVPEIYHLVGNKNKIYEPSLQSLQLPHNKLPIPNQWTLTIKAHDSGAKNFLMSGLAYVVFDKEDKAWIANNFRMGSAESGTHCIVLNADASPASISPIMGGGLLGAAFGIAVDPTGETIAIGNFGWGPELFNPQEGSISMFSFDGKVLSPPNGFTPKLSRVQGMCYDNQGNLWMASVGTQEPFAPGPIGHYKFENQNSAVVVYLKGDPENAIHWDDFNGIKSPFHSTFDVVMDSKGNAFVSNIGDYDNRIQSSVHKFSLQDGKLNLLNSWTSDYVNRRDPDKVGYENLRQVNVDSEDNVYVVGINSSRVVKFDNDLNKITAYEENIYAPWGVVFDKNDTMFLANFAQEKGRTADGSLDMLGPFGVSVMQKGDTTAKIMTLPTGGDEVRLASGHPLYGVQMAPVGKTGNEFQMQPSYEPLMRLTSTNIDGAGNLWAMNNWKPSAYVDVSSNPGGDGVVIFVGVAKPS